MKTRTYFSRGVRLLPGIVLLLAVGCATTQPSRFYSLAPIAEQDGLLRPAQGGPHGNLRDVSIGVGPVVVPDYLDRHGIVTRPSPETVEIAEFDRWAEPLDKSFARVLALNLSALLGTDKIAVFPSLGSKNADCQVVVEVFQFDGVLGREAVLIARYGIYLGNAKEPAVTGKTTLREPVKDSTYKALVSAEGETVSGLSREIASKIQSVPKIRD